MCNMESVESLRLQRHCTRRSESAKVCGLKPPSALSETARRMNIDERTARQLKRSRRLTGE